MLLVTIIAAIGGPRWRRCGSAAIPLSAVVTGLGMLSTLLVLYRVISPPGEPVASSGSSSA